MDTKSQYHLAILNEFSNEDFILDYKELYRKYLDKELDSTGFTAVITGINYFVNFDYAVSLDGREYPRFKLTAKGIDYKNCLLESKFKKQHKFGLRSFIFETLKGEPVKD